MVHSSSLHGSLLIVLAILWCPPPPQKNIVLADCDNHRVQVFDRNGNFVSRFGELGSLDHQLSDPEGLSINGKDNIIVGDRDNKLIKIFSSSGKYFRKFGGAGTVLWSIPITVSNTVNILQSQRKSILCDYFV